MRKAMLILMAGCLALTAVPSAFGQDKDEGWTSGIEADLNSKYIWRSLAWSEGLVLQPSFWTGTGGWSFTLWSNYVLNNEEYRHKFNEIDLRLGYEFDMGDFTIGTAVNIYTYPNQDAIFSPTTAEFELLVAYTMGSFTFETTHFIDVWDNKGGWVGEIGVEYENAVSGSLTLAAAARVIFANTKFNEYYIPVGKAAVNALVLEAGLSYSLPGGFYIRPHLEWNTLLDKEVKDAVAVTDWLSLNKSSLFNIGVAVGFEF